MRFLAVPGSAEELMRDVDRARWIGAGLVMGLVIGRVRDLLLEKKMRWSVMVGDDEQIIVWLVLRWLWR